MAGQFYPSEKSNLEKSIRQSFTEKLGPGTLPVGDRKGKVYGVVVPHAGYIFSGQCSAYAYKKIAEASLPDIFIILGANHTGRETKPFLFSLKDFETPFGIVRTNKNFIRILLEKNSDLFEQNEKIHEREHSIEVQLPFLQFVTEPKKLEIVPVIVSQTSLKNYEAFSDLIIETAKKLNKKICVIASSDMVHYGPAYGYMPFYEDSDEKLKKKIYDLDREAISNIVKFDVLGLINFVDRTKTTICGIPAIILSILICKKLGSKHGSLEKYYTSGEILDNYNNVVGYTSIVFE